MSDKDKIKSIKQKAKALWRYTFIVHLLCVLLPFASVGLPTKSIYFILHFIWFCVYTITALIAFYKPKILIKK